MRFRYSFAGLLILAAAPAFAQPAAYYEDAAIHAVQFVDASEGWAVGDDGVIWHSINGGQAWERQKSGSRASLRGLHFQNPYTGWVVGRIEAANRGPSIGVILKTTDGGLHWTDIGYNILPGLHQVRFINDRNGFVCGDGSDAFPSGMFSTADGGATWKPVTGPCVPGWRSADFTRDGMHGILAGAWSKLGMLRSDGYHDAEIDPLSGRTVHGVKLGTEMNAGGLRSGFGPSFAVGDGGLVMVSLDGGRKWGFTNLGLSPAALANCDFQCVAANGSHAWVAGRPGSFLLHTGDHGKTWETLTTNFPGTIHAMCFLDEKTGWIAGELGAIGATTDGGKTWKLQRSGGRAAVLFLHAHGEKTPLETMTVLGFRDGYRCAAVSLMSADPATASPRRAADIERLRFAVRRAGGTSAESAWCFPMAAHAAGLPPRGLLASWDRAHNGKANEQLLRQAVLAIRMWQPEVIVTDAASPGADSAEVLVLLTAKEAFKQAADPNAFPEQIAKLGLKPWDKAKKLYALCSEDPAAAVKLDLTEFDVKFASTARDLAEPAVRILGDADVPPRRCFKLLAHRLQGAETHAALMEGIALGEGGEARRTIRRGDFDPALLDVLKKSLQTRANLEGIAASPDSQFGGPEKALAALGAETKHMPDDMAARTAFALGAQFVRGGQWAEAREVFALIAERYPGHPLAVDAYRWLLRYHASSETRRRIEIQQKLAFRRVSFDPREGAKQRVVPANGSSTGAADAVVAEDVYRLYDSNMILKWHQAALEYEPKLRAFGPVYSRDPAAWLSLLAARRQVGNHAAAESFIRDYFKFTPGAAALPPGRDPWRDCLAAELWLGDRGAIPQQPKPLGVCRFTETRPLLDGKLDDACWKNIPTLPLKAAASASEKADDAAAFAGGYKTEARFAFDSNFLYIAVTCSHPAGQKAPTAARRKRDENLAGHDRIDILLDKDRDYQTYYRFQIDHRGCLAEDCWGDRAWNPKYFVAFDAGETGWTAEMAIPLVELTGEKPSSGHAWAANVTRVTPGQGIQAWSTPTDGTPRPEGMGILQFRNER